MSIESVLAVGLLGFGLFTLVNPDPEFDPARLEWSAELETETARFGTHVITSPGVNVAEAYRLRGPESVDCS